MVALHAPDGDDVFDDLIARWSEPHRHYHSISHLKHCLREIEDLPFTSRPIAELTAWFHDAVYVTVPGAPNSRPNARTAPAQTPVISNEEESAELARVALGALGIDTKKICAFVRATEKHTSTGDPDGDLFLDVDMSILGQHRFTFESYEAAVRKEWAWVAEDVFRKKRAEFLEMLAARETIFLTATMRKRYENHARTNIARSLARLRSNG
jgi:predicted metal-dependent HD superfamily phosphohydrolase